VRRLFLFLLGAGWLATLHGPAGVLAAQAATPYDAMVARGVFQPVANGASAPMTRGDFFVALQRLFNLREAGDATRFTDVPPGGALDQAVKAVDPFLGRKLLCPGCSLSTNVFPQEPISEAEIAFVTTRILVARQRSCACSLRRTRRRRSGTSAARRRCRLRRGPFSPPPCAAES
jgi:hypothetical protein